jgi:predicted MPP superfamily phosphohydrolase
MRVTLACRRRRLAKEPTLAEKLHTRRTPRWIALLAAALAAALVVVLAWSLVEARTLRVVEGEVTSPDLPAAFDGLRVVYLSDIHAGLFSSRARVAKVVDRVNALEPDLILLGGDNVGGKARGADKYYPEAARFSAPLGVFAVLGNHDVWEGRDEATARTSESGIELLDNSSARVTRGGNAIVVAGIDDTEGDPAVSEAATGIGADEFAILLSHGPDPLADQLPASTGIFDLALTGHAHGGQLTGFGLWAPLSNSRYGNEFLTGWKTIADTPMLVSNGVGTVMLPMRLGAPPQLHVITLRTGTTAVVR